MTIRKLVTLQPLMLRTNAKAELAKSTRTAAATPPDYSTLQETNEGVAA